MNDQTRQLIEEIAARLGVTAEHLWGVLVRQAFVGAITDCIIIALLAAVGLALIKSGIKRNRAAFQSTKTISMLGSVQLWMGAIIILASIACSVSSCESIASGVINPEYWALKQIIK